jgi:hypothetical protein
LLFAQGDAADVADEAAHHAGLGAPGAGIVAPHVFGDAGEVAVDVILAGAGDQATGVEFFAGEQTNVFDKGGVAYAGAVLREAACAVVVKLALLKEKLLPLYSIGLRADWHLENGSKWLVLKLSKAQIAWYSALNCQFDRWEPFFKYVLTCSPLKYRVSS